MIDLRHLTPLDKKRRHLMDLINGRKFMYRVRLACLWLLAIASWFIVWYAAIPMIGCAVLNAILAWRDGKVHRSLVAELEQLKTEMAIRSYDAYR